MIKLLNKKNKLVFAVLFIVLAIFSFCFASPSLSSVEKVLAEGSLVASHVTPNNTDYFVQTQNGKKIYFLVMVVKNSIITRYVPNGEVVLLADDEKLVVSFATKTGDINPSLATSEAVIVDNNYSSTGDAIGLTITPFIDGSATNLLNGSTEDISAGGGSEDASRQYYYYEIDDELLASVEGCLSYSVEYNFKEALNVITYKINYSFYCFRKSTYQTTIENGAKAYERPKVAFENMNSSVNYLASNEADSSAIYSEHYFNFNKSVENDPVYPKIEFDPNRLEVHVQRTYAGRVYEVADSGTGVYSQDVCVVVSPPETSVEDPQKLCLQFNNLGVYMISYKYKYTYNNTEHFFDTIQTNKDIINVIGYQIYYSDYASNTLKEFKNDEAQADISYLSKMQDSVVTVSTALEGEIPVSTNQAPVRFEFNGLLKTNSKIYTKTTLGWSDGKAFNNESISEPGEYAVNVVYTYENYKTQADKNISQKDDEPFSQWFYFRITNVTPVLDIKTLDGETEIEALYAGKYTNKNVIVKHPVLSPFDSPVEIVVKRYDFLTGVEIVAQNTNNGNDIILQNEGRYVVVMKYGKDLKKSTQTTFSIDKESIQQSLKSYIVEKSIISGNTIKGSETTSKLFVNSPFVLEWANKKSGANVSAYYSLIKLTEKATHKKEPVSGYDADNEVWVDSGYTLDYELNIDLKQIPYLNTKSSVIVPNASILSEPGLYYFYLEDDAGNNAKYFMFYDNTAVKFLQYKNNATGTKEYFTASSLNYVTSDVGVVWGTHKVFRVGQINNSNYNNQTGASVNLIKEYDDYLRSEKSSEYSDLVGFDSSNYFYIKNHITSKVVVLGDGSEELLKNSEYFIRFLNDNNKANEATYQFYVADSSNTDIGVSDESISVDKSLYNGSHKVTVSSDLSKSFLLYDSSLTAPKELGQYGTALVVSTGDEKATKNYVPTNKSIVYYAYVPIIDANIQVDSVNVKFYELVFDAEKKTYKYSDTEKVLPTQNFVDWDYSSGYKICQINIDSLGKTKPGKYIITRTYNDDDQSVKEYIAGEHDYIVREFVFFVDRNQLVSVPENTASGETYIKRIGEYYKTYVLADQSDKKVVFDSFHRQSQAAVDVNKLSSMSPILSTNKLPVNIMIPDYKYGYDDSGVFLKEGLGFNWRTSISNGLNSFYKIGFEILNEKGENIESSRTATSQNGYYSIYLNKASTYYVKMFDGMGNTWYYAFSILSIAPIINLMGVYEKEGAQNEEFTIYYENTKTNADLLKVTWTDPADNYIAKIDTEKLVYIITQNGNRSVVNVSVDDNNIDSNGLTKSFFINGDFKHGDKIEIIAQYEGEASYYASGYYSTKRTIIIDYTAPTDTLSTLVDGTIIANIDVLNATRDVGEKYNKTQGVNGDNLLPYVTYAVNSQTPIVFGSDTTEIYYLPFNSKYSEEGSFYESKLSTDDSNTTLSEMFMKSLWRRVYSQQTFGELFASDINSTVSRYIYQIVEVDAAGNLTIYSVQYFPENSETIVTYKTENDVVVEADLTTESTISALNRFELEDILSRNDNWSYYTIGEKGSLNKKYYLKAPIKSDGTVIAENKVIDLHTQEIVAFQDLFDFLNSSAYEIVISDRMNRSYRTIDLKIATENRRFNVEFKRDQNNIEILVNSDELLSIESIIIENGIANEEDGFDYTSIIPIEEVRENGRCFIAQNNTPDQFDNMRVTIVNNYNIEMVYYFIENLVNIENEVTGANIITSSMFADYYSAQDINFTYQNMLYSISVAIEDNGGMRSNVTNDPNQSYFELIDNADKTSTLKLKAAPLNYGVESYVGGDRFFVVTLISTIDESDRRSITFKIYNKLPKVVLKDDYGRDRTSLFGGFSITKNAVKCVYDETEGVLVSIKQPGQLQFIKLGLNQRFSAPGNYEIKCEFTDGLIASYLKTFVISEANFAVYELRGANSAEDNQTTEINPTGYYLLNGKSVEHYVTNYEYVTISWDSNLNIKIESELITRKNGVSTFSYRIYNTGELNQSQYIDEKIVVTIVPVSSNFLASDEIKSTALSSQVVVTKENYINEITYNWQPYNLDVANKILVTYKYNNQIVFEKKAIDSITLSVSGVHTLSFEDVAGNKQVFTKSIINSREYYEIHFVKSVVFTLNGALPIPYAIFDEDVVIALPSDDVTRSYYDTSGQPKIVAKHNGVIITPAKNGNSWTFSEPGYYEIYFDAKRATALKTDPFGFTIINPTASRFGLEYSKFENYQVISVVRNGEDIMQSLLPEGETVLNSLYSSITDDKTGPGRYSVTIRAKRDNVLIPTQDFEFSYWLNEQTIPIAISAKQGVETTNDISVEFNVRNVYDAVGDCVVKVEGFDDIAINGDTLSTIAQIQSIRIQEKGNYFVQIYSANGNLLFSYRVVKKDPLNGVSIALIVIGSILFVGLIIIFVRLRKKVRIR